MDELVPNEMRVPTSGTYDHACGAHAVRPLAGEPKGLGALCA